MVEIEPFQALRSSILISVTLAFGLSLSAFALPKQNPPLPDPATHRRFIARHEEALNKARASGDSNQQALELLILGRAHSVPGEESKAVDCFKKAAPMLEEAHDWHGQTTALLGLANAYSALGQEQLAEGALGNALRAFSQELILQRQFGDEISDAETAMALAEWCARLGKKEIAEAGYRIAWTLLLPPPTTQAELDHAVVTQHGIGIGDAALPGRPESEQNKILDDQTVLIWSQAAWAAHDQRKIAQLRDRIRTAMALLKPATETANSTGPGAEDNSSLLFPGDPKPDAHKELSDIRVEAANPADEAPAHLPLRPPTAEEIKRYQALAKIREEQREQAVEQEPKPATVRSTGLGNRISTAAPARETPPAVYRNPPKIIVPPAPPPIPVEVTATRAESSPPPPSQSSPVPSPVERYPSIEAPDSASVGQEIAVQVSLTADQIAPETKILSGQQNEGKVQLPMAPGERQWTLTVNLSAPGMELTRNGSNTAEITIDRDSDSTPAAFYLRAKSLAASANGKLDTRIYATLWHNGAFLARIARPLTIVDPAMQASVPVQPSASTPKALAASSRTMARTQLSATPAKVAASALNLNPSLEAPDITIVENRIGNTLRIDFQTSDPSIGAVYADIADPAELHNWINTQLAQMASLGRGFGSHATTVSPAHAADALNGLGDKLYDKYAPAAFKKAFFAILAKAQPGKLITIQVLSDDPSIPWELMRPAIPAAEDETGPARRMDFLGVTCSIARWPLSRTGGSRPPQIMSVDRSVVVAPAYSGAQTLAAANQELDMLKSLRGFTQVGGDYASVRQLALTLPQGIVHFAGHGAVNQTNGVPQFAILLENNEQMDPSTWSALVGSSSGAHPLFFFNACEVGESVQFMNDVDGWAPALLGNGATGYIGALWPVQDKTASLFAASFYSALDKSLAAGQPLNVASLLALTRARIYRQTGDATAFAYVFYGDPLLVLTQSPAQP